MTQRRRKTRWLARQGGVDFGPFTEEQLLAAIGDREFGLETLVASMADMSFAPIAEHPRFREHYDACAERWEVESVEADAEKHGRRMRTMNVLKGSTWWAILLVGALVLGGGGWFAWRLMHAEPTGLLDAVAIAMPGPLPEPPPIRVGATTLVPPEARAVPRLREYGGTNGVGPNGEVFDTAGVAIEGGGPDHRVTTLDFDAAPGTELSEAALGRITRAARKGLVGCAQEIAGRRSSFSGTRVTFVVRPGGLGSFTVGREVSGDGAFKACTKRVLKGISVPSFQGAEPKVTIPLHVQR